MTVTSIVAWLQGFPFARWRDALVLTTAWVLGVCVCWIFVVQPLWHQHQQANRQYQQALSRYQALQQLTAFLPTESKPLAGPHPSLTPSHHSFINSKIPKESQPLITRCHAPHTVGVLAVKECHWVWIGSQQTIANAINVWVQQPALILYQVRVIPFGPSAQHQWRLSVSGITLSDS